MGSSQGDLKRTPLYDLHIEAGAKMVEFAGFEMPVQYEGINFEHLKVRQKAGIFDISHMGQIEIGGKRAEEFLEYLLPNLIASLVPGRILYAPMCNEKGGIMDDLLCLKRSEDLFLLVVNASRMDIDYEWTAERVREFDYVSARNVSPEYAMIALQGPDAEEILSGHTDVNLSDIGYYWFVEGKISTGAECIMSRTGYTGEDGFEIICDPSDAAAIWEALSTDGAVPAGLGARDTLRLEAGYPLYGNDLTEDVTPLEARLGWTVKLDKTQDFVGKDALLRQKRDGLKKRLVGFKMVERAIPRSHQKILCKDGKEIGSVTSGTFSPYLKCGIGMGYVSWDHREEGTQLAVDIRGSSKAAEVVRPPFVKLQTRNK